MKTHRVCVALLVLTAVTPVRAAVISKIAVQGSIGGGGTSVSIQPSNTKDGSADPLALKDLGDESFATAVLGGTAGEMTSTAHACSGPPIGNPGTSGNANTRATVNYNETFTIVSDTLPVGSPVVIMVKLAAARSYRTTVVESDPPIQAGSASVNVDAFFGYNTDNASGNFQGHIGGQQIADNAVFKTTTGIFATPLTNPGANDGDPNAMESLATIADTVGGHFTIDLETENDATSGAIFPLSTDGDAQLSLNWGASVVGGQATLVASDGTALPGTDTVTGDRALSDLPPPPDEDEMPEPAASPLAASLLFPFLRRPSRRAA